MVGSDCNTIFKRTYISGSHYPSVWYPSAKQKSPFLHLFFSIKVCYGEISSRICAAATARRKRRRSKLPNPDRGHKSVILSVTENVWPPCPALPCPCPARQTDKQTDTMFALIYRINIWECEVNIFGG
jgi:hypothetical protein